FAVRRDRRIDRVTGICQACESDIPEALNRHVAIKPFVNSETRRTHDDEHRQQCERRANLGSLSLDTRRLLKLEFLFECLQIEPEIFDDLVTFLAILSQRLVNDASQ